METRRHPQASLTPVSVLRRLGLAAVLYGLPLVLGVVLAARIRRESPVAIDHAILEATHQLSSPALDTIMTLLTRSADFASLVSVLAFATIVLWLRRRFLDAAFILASVAGATSLNLILKEWFYRPRPDLWPHLVTEFGYSFPSGHAMMSSALVFAVVWLVWHSSRRWLAVGLGALYMVGVGFSRLYLGVHYPTDVVAGWCFSLLWVLIVAAALYGRWIGLGRFGR